MEYYDWIVFLPLVDGGGAYNRYFGRLSSGRVKVRGVMARRADTPPYVARMQKDLFELLAAAASHQEICRAEPAARLIWKKYLDGLPEAKPRERVIRRRVGRTSYTRRCAEAAAIKAHERLGLKLVPGMEMGYVVVDACGWEVEAEENATRFDVRHYAALLEKAWQEVAFVFRPQEGSGTGGRH
jgi:DNA polymerase I